jgi:hypothetical protein
VLDEAPLSPYSPVCYYNHSFIRVHVHVWCHIIWLTMMHVIVIDAILFTRSRYQ